MKRLLYLLPLVLLSCKKEEPQAYTVELKSWCFRCAIEHGHNGTIMRDSIGQNLPTDTIPHPTGEFSHSFTAKVGDEVVIRAHALQSSSRSVAVSAKSGGYPSGYEYHRPIPEDSTKVVEVRFIVRELDRWGQPKQ